MVVTDVSCSSAIREDLIRCAVLGMEVPVMTFKKSKYPGAFALLGYFELDGK